MDIRLVETMATTGSLMDPGYRLDPNLLSITLDYSNTEKDLAVIDTNLNYVNLPWQLGTDLVKKVFLTYNGTSCTTGQLLETVVMESGSAASPTQDNGFNNSNQWVYDPAQFRLDSGLLEMTNPNDYTTYPYDVSQGFTVVKTFLTAGSNYDIGDPQYTAFYKAPHLTTFQAANVESNKVYTDGWYTSYVIACKTYTAANPTVNGVAQGQIVFNEVDELFYINLTGTATASTPDADTTNWKASPTFEEWKNFLKNNMGPVAVNDPVYFIESQHLVTAELAEALLFELDKTCGCCEKPEFDMTHFDAWIRLTQKRMGAWAKFNAELFHKAQCILETARGLCNLCLYHGSECLPKSGKRC